MDLCWQSNVSAFYLFIYFWGGAEINFLFIYFFDISPLYFYFFTLQYSIGFVIHQHESATGVHVSLLFNMLSRLVITFLPRSKHLLIPWLQSPFAVILEPPKIKSATVSTVSPSISHEVMGPAAMILVF